jgi:hypothetical protein
MDYFEDVMVVAQVVILFNPLCFQFCLQELRRQFPGSHRVKRLTGMRFEAMER